MIRILWVLTLFFLISCGDGSEQPIHPTREEPLFKVAVMWQGVQNASMPCTWTEMFEGLRKARFSFPWNSYGESNGCLLSFLQSDQPKLINVFACQGVCKRNKNCSERECRTDQDLIDRAVDIALFLEEFGKNTELILTLELEDNYSHRKACDLRARVESRFLELNLQRPQLWRNPVHAKNFDFNDPCGFDGIELHNSEASHIRGTQTIPVAWSNDGSDLIIPGSLRHLEPSIDVPTLRRTIEGNSFSLSYIWYSGGNCLSSSAAQSPFPHNRNCIDEWEAITLLNVLLRMYD